MTTKRFTYHGPMTSMTLKGGVEVVLAPGSEVELNDSIGIVRRLVARDLLRECKADATPAPVASSPAPSGPPSTDDEPSRGSRRRNVPQLPPASAPEVTE